MALLHISSGLRPRLPEGEAVPSERRLFGAHSPLTVTGALAPVHTVSLPPLRRFGPVLAGRVTAILFACCIAAAASARADAPDLLQNAQAFAFSARAVDAHTLEARFTVAAGYYLYRDKLRFSVDPGVLAGAPALPPGERKHDEFFGDMQTYRGTVTVRLPLAQAPPGSKVTVMAESQGCADAGVCYPAQRQTVALALPTRAAPGPFVDAAGAKRSWFR